YPELGVVLPGKGKIRTPPGPHTAIVERGTEYRPEEIAVEGDVTRTVRLQRWIDMKKRGWWSGDLHVHRKPDEMPPLMEAADLHFAPVITRWNTNSNLDAWPEKPHFPAGRNRAYTVDNSEDERDWGAALFFGLKTPIGLYGRNAHYPPPTVTWREARARSAFIDQEKLIWWAAPMIAALVAPDSMGVANNHFMEESVMDNEAWGRKRDLAKYPGPRGFANYILDLYYLYLNAGFRIPASAGSANGVLKNPAGYSRSYVNLGGRFSAEAWLAGQKAGRNFVTNGPMLFLKVSGARVELEAISGGELEKAELVSGGKVVKTFEPGADRSRIAGSARVKVEAGGWLAARCFEKNNATVRFAHTSPVYFGAHAARTPEALAAMRGWLDALVEHIGQLPGLSMEQRTEWYALCAQAREVYQ
ncbi:MAG: CehA/McbA family metallohydrolase, partial [Acidobacteria bacterium]|nr:CehA/McbA family metallohydrolase [Acidobacteriota bacterium]